MVEKARVTLPTSLVRERDATHCTLQQPMNSYIIFFRNSCPVVILGFEIDIWVAGS